MSIEQFIAGYSVMSISELDGFSDVVLYVFGYSGLFKGALKYHKDFDEELSLSEQERQDTQFVGFEI